MLARRQDRRNCLLIGVKVSADLHVESLALEFKICQRIVSDQTNQFAQLFHVDGSLEVLRQRTVPAAAAIAMPLRPCFVRLFGSGLLAFLVAHHSLNSGGHETSRGFGLASISGASLCYQSLFKAKAPRWSKKGQPELSVCELSYSSVSASSLASVLDSADFFFDPPFVRFLDASSAAVSRALPSSSMIASSAPSPERRPNLMILV